MSDGPSRSGPDGWGAAGEPPSGPWVAPGWQQPGPPPGWQQPGPPQWQPGPPQWQPGPQQWQPGPQQAWQQPGPAPGAPPWPPQPPPGWGPGGWAGAPKPGVVPLRPLGVGEILDGAVTYVRRNPRATLGLAAVVVTLTQLVQVPTQLLLLGDLDDLDALDENATAGEVAGAIGGGLAATLLGSVLSFVGLTVLSGLLVVVLSRAVLGAPISLGEAWRAARPRLPGLLALSVLTALLLGAVLAAGAVPIAVAALAGAPGVAVALIGVVSVGGALCLAVHLWVALSLATPAYVLEPVGVLAALGRSRRLVRAHWWRIFGVLLLTAVISAVLGAIIGVPFGLAGGALGVATGADTSALAASSVVAVVVSAVGTIIASTLTAPFGAGVTGLLYVDQRMRREAWDLELQRAAGVGPPGRAS